MLHQHMLLGRRLVGSLPSSSSASRVSNHLVSTSAVTGVGQQRMVPQLDECDNSLVSLMSQVQIRGKKKRRKRKALKRRIIEEDLPEGVHPLWGRPGVVVKPKVRPELPPPKYRPIIFRRDYRVGLKGEVVTLKAAHGYRFLQNGSAVRYNENNVRRYVDVLTDEEKQELQERRYMKNKRTIIDRAVVQFKRKILSPSNEYYWPITVRDIVNRIWNVYKVALREDQITMPKSTPDNKHKPVKKPGYHVIWVDLEDGLEPAMVRLYLEKGGDTYDGLPH